MSPVAYIPRTRELYSNYPPYRWVVNDDPPWTPLSKPLGQCRVALLTSGGVHHVDQPPFHFKEDTSIREIPTGTAMADLRVSHYGYRTEDASADPNCVFPLQPMRELGSEGLFGELVDPAYAIMGGVYSARRVKQELVPALMERFSRLRVDVL